MHENPFRTAGQWYRGNLHAHTTESDGDLPPGRAVWTYRHLGYDLLAITDHGKVTVLPEAPRDLILVPGVEVSCGNYHLVALGVREVPASRSEAEVGQVIADVAAQRGLTLLAHPYWSGLATDQCLAAAGCCALEVYNTGCDLEIARGYSFVHWDDMLSRGAAIGAIAVDDGHHAAVDHGLGWVWVRAEAPTAEAILSALARGSYYASCGPRIEDISLAEGALTVRCSAVREIAAVSQPGRGNVVRADPVHALTEARFDLGWMRGHVRVQVTDALGRMAWSNPFRVPE